MELYVVMASEKPAVDEISSCSYNKGIKSVYTGG